MTNKRLFFLTDEFSRNEFKELLSSLLMALTFKPQNVWIVSPWLTDFDLLDKSLGNLLLNH